MRDVLDIVVLLGGSQGVGLAAVLARRRDDRVANRLLSALVGALSLMLVLGVLGQRLGFSGQPHLLGLGAPLPFLFGPLLYLYVSALTRPAERFEARWLLHGIPFAADVLFMLGAFYLKAGPEKLALAQAQDAGRGSQVLRLFELLLATQATAYLAASWAALRAYSRRIHGYFSDLGRIDLRWLMGMVLAHAAVWSVVIVGLVLRAAGALPESPRGLSQVVQAGSILVVFATGYVSLWQPALFQKARAAQVAEPARRPLPRYQRNRIDDREAAEIARRLTAHMSERKPYRDGALTLQALADAVGVTPHMLSQVLNLHLRRSFYAFVNAYRAEELIAALSDPGKGGRGVLELALDAGFSSKSTLNAFFKRYTGVTPTEFRLARAAGRTRGNPAG